FSMACQQAFLASEAPNDRAYRDPRAGRHIFERDVLDPALVNAFGKGKGDAPRGVPRRLRARDLPIVTLRDGFRFAAGRFHIIGSDINYTMGYISCQWQ